MYDDLLFKLDTELPAQVPVVTAVAIFTPVADNLKQIANQPNSIAALMVLRQAKQTLDAAIKQHENDKSFVAQLFLLAIEENDLIFIKLLQQRCDRYFGRAATRDFLLGYRNQQEQSFFAVAVARNSSLPVIKYFIDDWGLAALVKCYADDEHLEKLLFCAVANNDCRLLGAIKDELETLFGLPAANNYLNNCCNNLEQSLLSHAVVFQCSQRTLMYLVETLSLPITQEVIFNALHSKNELALQYFITYLDKSELFKNKLVWLSNVLTAYAKEFGTSTLCQVYQAQIATRRQSRQLFLTFKKEEVVASPRVSVPAAAAQETKQASAPLKQEVLEKKPANAQQRQQITLQLQQAERGWEKITQALQKADRDKQQITFELGQLATAKKYIAAEAEAKQTLSRTQQWRLTWNPDKSFIGRGLHWLFDQWGISSRQDCQKKQEIIAAAKQTLTVTKPAFKTVSRLFRKANQVLTLDDVQTFEHQTQQKQQDNEAQLKLLSHQQHDLLDEMYALQKTLRRLDVPLSVPVADENKAQAIHTLHI